MTKRSLLALLAVLLLLSTGCMFFRKSRKPKQHTDIANQVETEFRDRWIAKRASELTAQGVAEPAARVQAAGEYDQKFKYAIPGE